jgi:hypothetical protein
MKPKRNNESVCCMELAILNEELECRIFERHICLSRFSLHDGAIATWNLPITRPKRMAHSHAGSNRSSIK